MKHEDVEQQQYDAAPPDERPSLPLGHSLSCGVGTFLAAGVVDVVAHFGLTGLVVAGIAAYAASQHGPDLLEQVRGAWPTRPSPSSHEHTEAPRTLASERDGSKRSILDRALGHFPVDEETSGEDTDTVLVEEALLPADEGIFSQASRKDVPRVPRITVEQIVQHITPNSYKLYIGRSLTRDKERYPAVQISFFKRHLKIIGASQKGKSALAAALLDIITRTHDTDHVLVALLDLEDQTSKLFAHLPHIAVVQVGGEDTRLHARTREQVLEYLGYVLAIMEYRYTLTKLELAEQPVLLVYIEEFLALKDYFKRRIDSVRVGEKDQAKADYAHLIFAISELARRGLKARVQLLLCAQVDYRDEDLQEALVNITAGMSFAVRVTAAQAAGFYNLDLLKRNAIDNTIGQAVVETPDCNDLVLTPDYDLEQRLLTWEQAELEQERRQQRRQAAPLELRGTHHGQAAAHSPLPAVQPQQEPEPAESDLDRALRAWDEGYTTIDAMAVALHMSPWTVRPLYQQIKRVRKDPG